MNWKNGKPARVVATKGSIWAVVIQNESGAVLICDDDTREAAYPYPGNRGKTMAEAKRIAKAHDVPAYVRHPERGHILIK